MPSERKVNSIPRKNDSLPKFLIGKDLLSEKMRKSIKKEHEDVMIMSSTYIKIKVVIEAICMINREGSACEVENP